MSELIKVLIADDNIDFSNLLADYLSQMDFIDVIGVANNGLQAVEMIQTALPDIVLMDIIMPKMDGFGVLEQINKISPENRTQVILISAFGQERITRIAADLGADFFVIKPFDFNILTVRIKQLYSSRHITKEKSNTPANLAQNSAALQISSLLNRMGVPSHLKGYGYMEYAGEILLCDPAALNNISRKVYTRISQKFETTPPRVEKAIRNAIEQTFCNGNLDYICDIFGSCLNGEKLKPSNCEFFNIFLNELHNRENASYFFQSKANI